MRNIQNMNESDQTIIITCWIINLSSIYLAGYSYLKHIYHKRYVLSHSPRLAAPAICQQDANAVPIVHTLCLKDYLISRKLQSTFSFLLPYSLEIPKVKIFEVLSGLENFTFECFGPPKTPVETYFQSQVYNYDTFSNQYFKRALFTTCSSMIFLFPEFLFKGKSLKLETLNHQKYQAIRYLCFMLPIN